MEQILGVDRLEETEDVFRNAALKLKIQQQLDHPEALVRFIVAGHEIGGYRRTVVEVEVPC